MEQAKPTTVQLCGHFVVELRGRRLEDRLPRRQGRILFAYLALQRPRAIGRDELVEALWPRAAPSNAGDALTVLLSKLRTALGADALVGRGSVRLSLPAEARVDVETALAAVHRAESAVVLGDWPRAWSGGLCAQFIARRPLLDGTDLPWVDTWRLRLDDVLDRALEAYAAACLGLGGTEIPAASRAARLILERNPIRETGYRLLMQALADDGNVAQALQTYEHARTVLRDELGIPPGPAIQALHAQLLGTSTTDPY